VKAGCAFDLFHRRSKDYGLAGQQMKNFFYVYILVSQAKETTRYTGGITRNLEERLLTRNRGACAHTSNHRPWRVETAVAFNPTKSTRLRKILEKWIGS
jgi:predicted GIY-YIG superfamily endonuclease